MTRSHAGPWSASYWTCTWPTTSESEGGSLPFSTTLNRASRTCCSSVSPSAFPSPTLPPPITSVSSVQRSQQLSLPPPSLSGVRLVG
eukprot:549487-Hanusia_phi.AAC.3